MVLDATQDPVVATADQVVEVPDGVATLPVQILEVAQQAKATTVVLATATPVETLQVVVVVGLPQQEPMVLTYWVATAAMDI